MKFIECLNILDEIFSDIESLSATKKWELQSNDCYQYHLIINGLLCNNQPIIYACFTLYVDSTKTNITNKKITYSFGINDKVHIKFDDENDLRQQIQDIISEVKFADEIKDLSKITLIDFATNINKQLNKQGKYNLSVYNVNYTLCNKSYTDKFDYEININEKYDFKLKISKNKDNLNYKISGTTKNESIVIDLDNLSMISIKVCEIITELFL